MILWHTLCSMLPNYFLLLPAPWSFLHPAPGSWLFWTPFPQLPKGAVMCL